MKGDTLGEVIRRIGRSVSLQSDPALTDAQLLERFVARRHEPAFAALVARHGPMVHGLCRRLLRRREDADDAFQAAFLILVRKSRSISKRISLASWLYKVTYRVALEVQAREAKHAVPARCDAEFPAGEPADDAARRDLQRVIAEEVDRLPEKYRLPVVLCYLSGKTTEEAARRLGCPRGTILSRLATARKRLHGRLVRRGLGLTAVALAAALEQKAVASPAVLVSLTVKAAAWLAAGSVGGSGAVSGPVLLLMRGALKTMFVQKLKWAAAILMATTMVGGGGSLWLRQPAVAQSPTRLVREAAPALKAPDEPRTAARNEETNRPLGSWERDAGGVHLMLRFEEGRIYGTCVEGKELKITLDADYSVTKDNLLYGVVTGVDAEGTGDEATKKAALEATSFSASAVDYPFSFRYRVDGNVLLIKDSKFGGITAATKDKGELATLQGRWKKKTETGKGPTP